MFLCLVLQADLSDRVLSTSEESLPCLNNSKAEPLIRSRPLSDIFPFQSHTVPYLLPGCGAQVQPMTAGSLTDESRLNGINSSAWSNPVIAQPEGKPHSSRIMRLFSSSRKGPIPAPSPTTDSPASTHSMDGNSGPQSWSGLSGLGVVDSFKKLRSSVLQGIQNRGATNHEGNNAPSSNGVAVTNIDSELNVATNPLKIAEGCNVSNGHFTGQNLAVTNQCVLDIDDYYDEEIDEGDGLQRNSRFSRSIRRAYGAGRISLWDMENGRLEGRRTDEAVERQTPDQRSKTDEQTENMHENTNVKVISRLSRSAENLHIFKAPFRRKTPTPPSPQADSQRSNTSNGTLNIQRSSSASSVDLRGHSVSQRKNPVRTKGPMLKLIGSMTDLSVRRRQSPSPSPTSPSLMTPLSRLHDDYSRRVPCLTTSERQRRPSPVRARVMSLEHSPLIHPRPEYDISSQQHPVHITQVFLEPPERAGQKTSGISDNYESMAVTTTFGSKQTAECDLFAHNQKEQTEASPLPNEVSWHIIYMVGIWCKISYYSFSSHYLSNCSSRCVGLLDADILIHSIYKRL